MEQIIYCQDQVYKEALKTIREEEAEKQKARGPATFLYNSQFPQKELTTPEMTQHLKAYYQVKAGMLPAGLAARSHPFRVPLHIEVCV